MSLHRAARAERRRDAGGVPDIDPGTDRIIDECTRWLARAQDESSSSDGGVARHYSLTTGWSASYPETTGYIIPTMLDYAVLRSLPEYRVRARRMLDWLVGIQLPGGGFQGGMIGAQPVVPVTFNTGQIAIGLAAGVKEFGDFTKALRTAADWLRASLDPDGCWRKFPTPFAKPGEKVYETHVAWGLFEAARVLPSQGFGEAGMKQVQWALTWQQENGWLDRCCLTDPIRPLTHTLGYALRGVVEAYRFSNDSTLLDAAKLTADGLMSAQRDDGSLAGRLFSDWRPAAEWSCLTGNVQIAHSWLLLFKHTKDVRYRDAAYRANQYVRRTIMTEGAAQVRGGVKGSFPVNGDYGRYEYLNWAAKFAVDSNIAEQETRCA